MTWIVAHSALPISKALGSSALTIHPFYTERGAKRYAQEQVAKGDRVTAQPLNGITPLRTIKSHDVSRWLRKGTAETGSHPHLKIP